MNRDKCSRLCGLLVCSLLAACGLPADRQGTTEPEEMNLSLVAEPMEAVKDEESQQTEAEGQTQMQGDDESAAYADTPDPARPDADVSAHELQTTEPEILHFIDAWDEWHDAEIDSRVARHDYDWECLRNTEEGIYYENDPRYVMRRGVDVSHHQGEIDWRKVKAAGYDFAIIRLGYRGYGQSGSLMVDKQFRNNVQRAQKAGLEVGVYLFSQAINEEEAREEARLVLEELSDLSIELPVVYDPELIRDETARTDDVTGEQFTKNTVVFCEMMEEAGYQPMIYSNMVWEAFLFDMNELQKYPFWYADYEPVPQTPYQFTYWQYSESGSVDGIAGKVDLDVQFIPAQTEQ